MDLAIPTTSKATKPKRRRRPKLFTLNRNKNRKLKNVRVKLEVEKAHDFFEIEKILRKAEFVSSGGEVNMNI